MMIIDIYGKDDCPYCTKALRLAQGIMEDTAEQHNHTINYYKLDRDFTREELFEKFPTARTFPQIMVDNTIIGGYDQFNSYIKG